MSVLFVLLGGHGWLGRIDSVSVLFVLLGGHGRLLRQDR